MGKYLTALVVSAGMVLGPLGCNDKSPEVKKALNDFDAYVSVECPTEAKIALARALKAKPDEIKVAFYGPTGKGSEMYFAAISRQGKVLVGVYEEAWTRVIAEHYEASFDNRQFPWAVKCLRNDPPFSDRQVRYERTFPTAVKYGPTDVKVEFIDGWIAKKPNHNWSFGYVRVNLDGTVLLEEKHDLDFIFTPRAD